MKMKDIQVGQKLIYIDRMYLRIDMNMSSIVDHHAFDNFICVLDLSTYKVMCLDESWEVEYYGDNVPV